MQLRDVLAEWYECKDRHLEVLDTERNAYDGAAEYDSQSYMRKCYLNATEHDPDDVHDQGKASAVIAAWRHVATKRA